MLCTDFVCWYTCEHSYMRLYVGARPRTYCVGFARRTRKKFFKFFKSVGSQQKAILCFLMSLTETNIVEKNSLRVIGEHAVLILPCDVRKSVQPFHEMFREGNADGEVGDGVFARFDIKREQKWYWLITNTTHEAYPLPRQQSVRAHKRR